MQSVVEGNAVSAVVFWPLKNEALTPTAFLLICLSVLDNLMLFFYYFLLGVPCICGFNKTCYYYMKVNNAAEIIEIISKSKVFSEKSTKTQTV